MTFAKCCVDKFEQARVSMGRPIAWAGCSNNPQKFSESGLPKIIDSNSFWQRRNILFLNVLLLTLLPACFAPTAACAQESANAPAFAAVEDGPSENHGTNVSDATSQLPPAEFLGVPLFDDDFYKLLLRLLFNLTFVGLVVGVAYRWHQDNKGYMFTFLLMNIIIFFICFTLKKLDLGIGMALGLFAIFAIIRYRTDAIPVKEMTYLFIVVGLAVINSLSNKKMSYAELLFTNLFIFGATLALEGWFTTKPPAKKAAKPKLDSQDLIYDNIDLLRPERQQALFEDLRSRTGLNVQRVAIRKIDLTNGSATITVRYPPVDDD